MTAGEDALRARFDALVRAQRERVIGLAWQLVGGDRAAAEDVAQEAFLRAYRALPRFRDDAALETWLFRIVVRQAANHRRWAHLRRRLGLDAPAPDDSLPAAAVPQGDPALVRRIAGALERLSGGQREVFVLVHLQGLTVVEAAELLGRAPGTVKSHLHRALVTLRAELADLEPGAPGGRAEEEGR
jgi:RNA polymerase sigma-70 factor (ECF subfamily)